MAFLLIKKLFFQVEIWPISCLNDLGTQKKGLWGVKIPKKLPRGARPRAPLEACASGARLGNLSVFILDPHCFRACLHGGGGSQLSKAVTHQSMWSLIVIDHFSLYVLFSQFRPLVFSREFAFCLFINMHTYACGCTCMRRQSSDWLIFLIS